MLKNRSIHLTKNCAYTTERESIIIILVVSNNNKMIIEIKFDNNNYYKNHIIIYLLDQSNRAIIEPGVGVYATIVSTLNLC